MKKGRIVHLEDDEEWIEHVEMLLGNEYDLYSVRSKEEASQLFYELATDGQKVDLAIVDISLVPQMDHDKGGLTFIDALEKSGIMLGHSIVVLSAYPDVDENLRIAFRDYSVSDVYDKGKFQDEKAEFKHRIERLVAMLHE